jgi:hypothetical protein
MGVAITDLLIELSDPQQHAEFLRDPDGYLANRLSTANDFSAEERVALLSRDIRKIRRYARSTESTDPTEQFNRSTNYDITILDIDEEPMSPLDPHIHGPDAPPPDDAIEGRSQLYVDQNGTFYRAVRSQ